MNPSKVKIITTLTGQSLWPTIYVLVYSLYVIVFSLQLNLTLIRCCYLIYYGMSLWYCGKILLLKVKPPFIRILNLLFFTCLLYGVLLIFQGTSHWPVDMAASVFFQVHLAAILPIYAFYYYGRYERINPSWFACIFIVFFIDAFFLYYHEYMILLEEQLDSEEGFTNNAGYVWASLLPLVAFFKRKISLQYLVIAILTLLVISCFKRGAMLVCAGGILYYFLISFNRSSIKQKTTILILGLILLMFISQYFSYFINSNEYFAERIEATTEGDSSGRNSIYGYFINYFFHSNDIFHFLFGNGAAATAEIYGIEAHNDWLEYAIDMGLFGLILYALFWVRIVKNYRFYSKYGEKRQVLIAMGMFIIMNLMRSFFSMSFNDMSFFTAAVFGYTMSVADTERKSKIIDNYK